MGFRCSLTSLLLLTLYGRLVYSENIPCNVREAVAGYVCVCNATYCDTIERPTELSRGWYLHYSTAKSSPGFTVATGNFTNTTRTLLGGSNDVFITVDSGIQYQTFEGFGASLTAGAGIMINSLPAAAQQKFIEAHFGETGLEYNMVRVPIAASDFSPRYYTYDDVPGDVDLKCFNLTEEDFQLKIPILKMAVNASKRGVKLIGTTWTAPDWMKTSNNYKMGYIYTKYLSVWANYHLKFLQAYKQNGIEFWGLTQGNEVNIALLFGPWFPIQNTMFPPLVARYWTKKYLGPLLKTSGFEHVKVLAMDDERPFMLWYMDRMLADAETAQYVDGVAVHWYLDSTDNLHILQDFHNKHPDKLILYTEASINFFNSQGGGAVDMGDWERAQRYIESILNNLNNWVVGYIDWNIALNDQGGPTGPANLTLDAAVIINKTNGEFYKQPLFYAIGHFSKFIPPGAKKINVTVDQPFKDGGSYFEFDGTEVIRRQLWVESPPTGRPYPSTGGPYLTTGGPYPTTGGPYPTTEGPYPTTGGPYPTTGGPYPTTGGPYPTTGGPYPTTGGPYPTTGGPYPTTGGPYPTTGGPYPTTGGPYPTTGGPYPTTGGPYPTTGGPYPPTGSPGPTGIPPTGGPGPTGNPPPSTEAPFPTRPPDPPVTIVTALASSNPDGSFTVIAYNPRSEPVNIIIIDSKVGVLNQTVEAKSLNTFVYW